MTASSKRRRTTLATSLLSSIDINININSDSDINSNRKRATMIRQPLRKQRPLSTTTTLRYKAGTRKILCVAAAAAFSTSFTTPTIPIASAWLLGGIANHNRHGPMALHRSSNPRSSFAFGPSDPFSFGKTTATTRTQSRLYWSSRIRKRFQNDDNDTNRKELFGFRRAAKNVARKILPTKWFGTQKEKEALERKQQVKDRVQGELDQMLKGAPLPFRVIGKFVAAPLMGKVASKVAEASYQQAEIMESILDETRSCLINDRATVDLLGMPIQLGRPHSQSSATTIINGKRQMRMEFVVELSGPKGSGMSRVSATNEGVGQLLVEAMGRVYQVDLSSNNESKSSSNRFEGSSSSAGFSPRSGNNPTYNNKRSNSNNDDNIIEAEIIDKKTNR